MLQKYDEGRVICTVGTQPASQEYALLHWQRNGVKGGDKPAASWYKNALNEGSDTEFCVTKIHLQKGKAYHPPAGAPAVLADVSRSSTRGDEKEPVIMCLEYLRV